MDIVLASSDPKASCRTCLNNTETSTLFDIFNENGLQIVDQIVTHKQIIKFLFVDLNIKYTDGLPQHVCQECLDKFLSASGFFTQCEYTREYLIHNCASFSGGDTKFKATNEEYLEEFENVEEAAETVENISAIQYDFKIEEVDLNDIEQDEPVDFLKDEEEELEAEVAESSQEISETQIEDDPDHTLAPPLKGIENNNLTNQLPCTSKNAELSEEEEISVEEDPDMQLKSRLRNRPVNSASSEYRCLTCGVICTTANRLKVHESIHKEKTLKCEFCSMMYKRQIHLTQHIKSAHANFECPKCSVVLTNKKRFQYHMKSHESVKRFQCKFCEKSFLQSPHLHNHLRMHTKERPFLCSHCGRSFKQAIGLKMHELVHAEVRPFSCDICSKSYTTKLKYNDHVKQHHSDGQRLYKCDQCDKTFAVEFYLKKHMERHDPTKKFQCQSCEQAFRQSEHLRNHMYHKHNGPKPIVYGALAKNELHECAICNKTFPLPSSLKHHMKTHADNRPFGCSICGVKFRLEKYLKTHLDLIHLDKKPHACDQCPKRFLYPAQLKEHMLAHTGEKPYSCSVCSKQFRFAKQHAIHERIHSGEKPLGCDYCDEKFRSHHDVRLHVNQKHRFDILEDQELITELNNTNNLSGATTTTTTKSGTASFAGVSKVNSDHGFENPFYEFLQ